MTISSKFAVIGLIFTMLSACQLRTAATIYDEPSAIAVLAGTQGSPVRGMVTFVRKGGATLVNANITGFKPNSTHGMHIHEIGDCSARDASSAGAHFNPTSTEHGAPTAAKHHGGDLGNVTADSKGEVYTSFEITDGAFGTGPDSIIGRALVVHVDKDDLTSQPGGNAGARAACGVITRNPDRMTYPKAD